LARFVSFQLAGGLVEIDTPLSLTRYQPAAVLFVDMIDSTAYCSKMTPGEVIALLRDLLALLSKCVFSQHGTIDKVLGDGLMAVFGLPLPRPADVTNAARCASRSCVRSIVGMSDAIDQMTARSALPSAFTMRQSSGAILAVIDDRNSR
jgi:class 3 adenylate cyclase